ncbi:MAG: L-rhamnose mutarotase [Chitinophagaceae bacterium]
MQKTKRYGLALDLTNDCNLIAEYEAHHRKVWPEILESIKGAGIVDMEIYRWGNRLFMMMEVDENFSFETKATADAANPKVQEWEALMWKYQQALPGAQPGEKWQLMKPLFSLSMQKKV